MWIRNFRRGVSEAFSGLAKNALMTAASIIVVTSCLILFGVFLFITLNINNLASNVADSCEITVYITEEADKEGKIQSISNQIKKLEHMESITYEDGVETFKKIKKKMPKDQLDSFSGLPDDVMSDSFTVKVDAIENSMELAEQIRKIDGVESVKTGEDVVGFITTFNNIARQVSFWAILAFMLISIFIISNTIKLTVHNRRREINIMKYIGATDAYIRWPFIMEGILVGLISAGVAFAVTYFAHTAIDKATGKNIISILEILKFKNVWDIFAVAYAVLGVIIGAIGSGFSIRKYLKV